MKLLDFLRYRFSLKDSSFENVLSYVFWAMKWITFNLDRESNETFGLLFNTLCYISLVLFQYAYVFSTLWYVGWVYAETKDTISTMSVLACSFSSGIGTMKYIFVLIRRKELTDTITWYRSVDAECDVGPRYDQRAQHELRTVKMRCIICYWSFIINTIFFVLAPLFREGRHFPQDAVVFYGLEPNRETPYYQLSYTVFFVGDYMAIMVPACVTILLIFLVGYIEAHLLALAEEFRLLWADALNSIHELPGIAGSDGTVNGPMMKVLNDFVQQRLNLLIGRHCILVNMVWTISKLFTAMILLEFLLTVVSLLAVLLGRLENTFLLLPYAATQLMVDCLLGQSLMNAGLIFEARVYDCGWENFNCTNMRSVAIVLQNSQRSLLLTAGGIITLSFESCLAIGKSLYSAYATFRRTIYK